MGMCCHEPKGANTNPPGLKKKKKKRLYCDRAIIYRSFQNICDILWGHNQNELCYLARGIFEPCVIITNRQTESIKVRHLVENSMFKIERNDAVVPYGITHTSKL